MAMSPRARVAAEIVTGALVLGVLGDVLLRAAPWGVNILLWMLAALMVVAVLAPQRPEAVKGAWLALPALIFAAGFAWRASPVIAMLNLLGLGVTASLALLCAQGGRVLDGSLAEYVLGALLAGLNAAFGALPLGISEVPWKELFASRGRGRALAAARGVLLAVLPLVVFGALFASADAVFKSLVKDVFNFDLSTLASHGLLIAFFAWVSAGWLRGAALGEERKFVAERASTGPVISLGIIEIAVVLGLVDLLFLSFVIVQVRYLFGGAAQLQATSGLTYAEYARSGFFQLVTVAALSLPLLLAAHWTLRKENSADERKFRALAGLLVLLLFVILASAFQRMRLYQSEYGLTELRVYTTAFMVWLAVVLAWFAVTVLRGDRKHFAVGALVAGYGLILALEVLNPDALIARTNLERAREGRKFDARYVASLSSDAVPQLVAALPQLSEEDRCIVSERLLKRWSRKEPGDWRTWNYARQEADKAMNSATPALRRTACSASGAN
jgi:Domain of unknown function (DUF4153)